VPCAGLCVVVGWSRSHLVSLASQVMLFFVPCDTVLACTDLSALPLRGASWFMLSLVPDFERVSERVRVSAGVRKKERVESERVHMLGWD
jgi:hypothetical protein